jgi:serine/threonine protein phosphatase PrpC
MAESATTSGENGWRATGISVTGSAHLRLEVPCQDANAYEVLLSDVLIAVVADGAGSAAHSEIGSQAAVQAVAEAARNMEPGTFESAELCRREVGHWICKARKAVQEEADKRAVCSQELATTLIVLVGTRRFVVAAQIGDGATVIETLERGIETLTRPMRGEYANETVFITSEEAENALQVKVVEGTATNIAAFSDGLQSLALEFPDAIAHKAFFTPLFDFIADSERSIDDQKTELRAFLESPRMRERTEDDLTLILAHHG